MPTNKKEGLIFGSLMCFLMVLGMSIYNLTIHNSLSLLAVATGLVPAFVVGVVAKKIAFALPIKKESKLQLILTISTLMILGMVTFMSIFGMLMEGGIPADFLGTYLKTWGMNFIAAFPYQLLIVGPFSRLVLGWVQNGGADESAEEAA